MPHRKLLSPAFTSRIETAIAVLGQSVDALTVRNWLENFNEQDWDVALRVLERIKFFSLDDTIKAYNEYLEEILQAVPADKTIFLLASSEYGKSGSAMIYLVKNTPVYVKHDTRFQILEHGSKLKKQGVQDGDSLILVDDFVGTGESCLTYYNHYIIKQVARDGLKVRFGILCVAYLTEAKKMLREKIKPLKMFGSPYLKAFVPRRSPSVIHPT